MAPPPRTRRKRSRLGASLREVREKKSWSLRDIQARSDLNSGYLSQLERGEVGHPSPTVLRRIAKGYEIPFPVILSWAGYVDNDELNLTTNQAVALSTIGDPTPEELEALRGILDVLRSKRKAPLSGSSSDLPLDAAAQRDISLFATALLREADAIGKRPTPLEDLREAARLVEAGELTLTLEDRKSLVGRFGHWVDKAWKRLLGSLDYRSDSIWVKPGLHPMRERFVLAHELGHGILPAHRETFAHIDDWSRLEPSVRDLFEREANQAAVELLFQGSELTEEADASQITLNRICRYANSFGASIVATARRVAETSRREVAVGMAHQPKFALGPTHLYVSESFEVRFRWKAGAAPTATIRHLLATASPELRVQERMLLDAQERPVIVRLESIHTGYAAIVLIVREGVITRTMHRVFSPASEHHKPELSPNLSPRE